MARLVRVPLAELGLGERELDKKTARYLSEVLRLRAGDSFIAFDPAAHRQALATLTVTSTGVRYLPAVRQACCRTAGVSSSGIFRGLNPPLAIHSITFGQQLR